VSTKRVEAFEKKSKQKPIHLILAVPHTQHNIPVRILRKRMSHILKLGKIVGASVIFHPFSYNDSNNGPFSGMGFII